MVGPGCADEQCCHRRRVAQYSGGASRGSSASAGASTDPGGQGSRRRRCAGRRVRRTCCRDRPLRSCIYPPRKVTGMPPTRQAISLPLDPSHWIEHGAREYPDHTFLKTPGGNQLGYALLRERSGEIACALMRRGVVSGDRVAVRVEKSAEAVLLYVACLRLGPLFVPINVLSS